MTLQEKIAQARSTMASTFEEMTPLEYEQFRVDGLNKQEGQLNTIDGYECNLCKNKGIIYKVRQAADGTYSHVVTPCKCEPVRRSILRMRESGLEGVISKYTFHAYKAEEPWQRMLQEAAEAFADEPLGFFFIGGQSGAGKTHLCTAICRELLLKGKEVLYMLWRDEVAKLKSSILDADGYSTRMEELKNAEVLYIDDLFKAGRGQDKVTAADINIAFELINYRSLKPGMATIISSELTEGELLDIDEAVAGRILQTGHAYSIAKNRDRNYRLKGGTVL